MSEPSRRAALPGVAWLHGYTMHSGIWSPLWELLPDTRHVGIDLPRHGSAAQRPLPGSLHVLADEVADRMLHEGCRTLVGLSFGSCVALQVALDRPEVLDLLVLAAPTLAGPPDDPVARAKYLALYQLHRRTGAGAALARLWMADPPGIFAGLRAHAGPYAAMAQVVAQHPFLELVDGGMRALTTEVHTREQLEGLQVPVVVLVGTKDMPRFIENAALLADAVPRCTVHTLQGAGHLPLLEEPITSARLLAAAFTLGRDPERLVFQP